MGTSYLLPLILKCYPFQFAIQKNRLSKRKIHENSFKKDFRKKLKTGCSGCSTSFEKFLELSRASPRADKVSPTRARPDETREGYKRLHRFSGYTWHKLSREQTRNRSRGLEPLFSQTAGSLSSHG